MTPPPRYPRQNSLSRSFVAGEPPRPFDAFCAPEPGKDAFHRVPDFARKEWDAVERVLTIAGGSFMGRVKIGGSARERPEAQPDTSALQRSRTGNTFPVASAPRVDSRWSHDRCPDRS